MTEQGDLFYSAGLHGMGNCINLPNLMQLKSRERIWKNEGDWSGKEEMSTRKNLLAVRETCWANIMAYSRLYHL